MKKKFVIILIIILILSIIITFITIKKVTLNKSEEEVLSVLQDVNSYLEKPIDENENTSTISFKPKSPMSIKELVSSIHQVRKGYNENGNLFFLFDVSILDKDNNEMKSILYVSNGKLVGMTLNEELSKFLNINQETGNFENIFKAAYNKAIEKVNNHITNLWNESTIIDNINLKKIIDKL